MHLLGRRLHRQGVRRDSWTCVFQVDTRHTQGLGCQFLRSREALMIPERVPTAAGLVPLLHSLFWGGGFFFFFFFFFF